MIYKRVLLYRIKYLTDKYVLENLYTIYGEVKDDIIKKEFRIN